MNKQVDNSLTVLYSSVPLKFDNFSEFPNVIKNFKVSLDVLLTKCKQLY